MSKEINYTFVTEDDLKDALRNNRETQNQALDEFCSQNKHIKREDVTFDMLFEDLKSITKVKHYWDCKCILHN